MNFSAQPDWIKIARTRWPTASISGTGCYAVFLPQRTIALFSTWAEMLAAHPGILGHDSGWTKLKELPATKWIRKAHWYRDLDRD